MNIAQALWHMPKAGYHLGLKPEEEADTRNRGSTERQCSDTSPDT